MHGWMNASPCSFCFLAFPLSHCIPLLVLWDKRALVRGAGVGASPSLCCPCLASVPHLLAFRLTLSSFSGLWCLTRTRAVDTYTHTHTVKDAVGAMSGRQASGTVSGAPLLFSPPCHPRGPAPVPALAPGMPEGKKRPFTEWPALQRRGRATDAQDC